MTSGFLARYGHAFGRAQAFALRMSGLAEGEVAGEGAWVRDAAGARWLDFGSYGLHLLGHRHPDVVRAAERQLAAMGLGTRVLGSDASTRCAGALLAHAPEPLDRVMFANSGGEAIDMAARLVRRATGRPRLIALERAYHGRSGAALALSDVASAAEVPGRDAVEHVALEQLDGLRVRLDRGDVAAVFVEPVQGEGGIRAIPHDALARLRAACAATGTLFVLDEIQTGLGRCGTLWAAAGPALAPDVLVAGKTLGGGLLPIAAVAYASATIADRSADPLLFASSFAGGALAARVAETVVELVAAPPFLARTRALGERALARLDAELTGRDGVRDVRGRGLMLGVELEDAGLAGFALRECFARRLLVTFCLADPRVLRVYPPAVCSDEDLERGLTSLGEAIEAAVRERSRDATEAAR